MSYRPRLADSLRRRLLGWGPSLAVLLVLVCAAAWSPGPASAQERTAVFFSPLRVDAPFVALEPSLRAALTASMISTGRFAETVSASTEQTVQECVRAVNRDVNAETCWVRVGQGQGAQQLVSGELRGAPNGCTLTLRLTELETRVSVKMHFRTLQRCTNNDLLTEMALAARVLAGEAVAGGAGASSVPPAPPAVGGGPAIQSGAVTDAFGDLTVAAKPANGARLELIDPAGRAIVSGSPYKDARAPVGTWQVTVHSAGFATERRRFVVPPDEPTLLKLELQTLSGLEVLGSPSGAEVTVSGPEGFEHKGGLPWRASGLRPGQYKVEVQRTGYRTTRRTVQLPPGETTQVKVELSKGSGSARSSGGRGTGSSGKPAAEGPHFLRPMKVAVEALGGFHYHTDTNQGPAGFTSAEMGVRVGLMLRTRMQLALRAEYALVTYRASAASVGEPSGEGSGGHLGIGGDYAWYVGQAGPVLPFFRFHFMYWPSLSREGFGDYTGSGILVGLGLGLTLPLGSPRGLAASLSLDYGAAKETWEPKDTAGGASALTRDNVGFGATAGLSYYF